MSLHSQRRSNRYGRPPRRRGFWSKLTRVMVAAGLSSGALVGVVVATQSSASASGFGADAFINVDGSIRYVSSPASPANQFGWANSGATTPASTCTGSQVGVSGTNGLYDCGSPNPAVTNGVPVPPKYIGPANVLAQTFQTTPDGNVVPGCANGAAGTYDFPGSQTFNEGLSKMSYGFVTNVPQKDAISDAYVVSRINSSKDVEVYFGAQRTANVGDSHVDFQFLQDHVSVGGTCSGTFTGSREQGDMLVEVNYQIGGSSAVPNVYMWVCNTASPTGTKCDTTGNWVQQAVPSTPVLAAIEASNAAPIPCGGWVCQNLTSAGLVDTNEFVEGAINLGKFGFGVGCGSTVLVETRTSGQSGTSQLASLAKPNSFATCAPTGTTTTPSAKTIQLGQSLTDSVTVTGNASLGTPTGQVKFYVCSNVTAGCTSTANPLVGTTTSPNPVTLNSSGKATSPSYTPPAPGNYCFSGVYTPTAGNFYSPSSDTSADECFTVSKLGSQTATTASGTATFGGGTLSDSVSVSPTSGTGAAPTGTVQFYVCKTSGTFCPTSSGTPDGQPVGLTVPRTGSTSTATAPDFAPTSPGTWCFSAVYSGDDTYLGSQDNTTADNTDSSECVTVGKAPTQTSTTVFDAATNAAWTGSETVGASAYDTGSVVPNPSFTNAPTPTGTFSYVFFNGSGCSSTPIDAGSSSLTGHSSTEGPLAAGAYSFKATYSGDSNYSGSTGDCENFSVGQGTSSVSTVVFDAATNSAWTGAETGTPSAYDTSTVTASSTAIAPTGTISYQFFDNGTCAADTGTDAGTGLALGSHSNTEGPLSQGVYSFQATYSGDSNYTGSTGDCEPFTLGFPVVTASKSSSPADGSVVSPGQTVTYTITLSNAGAMDATGVPLIDAIPAGTTYVPGSASDGGTLSGTSVSWSGLTVPAGGSKAVTFQVTVNATDTDGQVIPNHAIFPDINTPQTSCIQSADTAPVLQTVTVASLHAAAVQSPALCDTNTVNLTVSIPIINVVKSEPTPGDGQTVTAGQSAPITYKLAVTNAGSADATNVVVIDVIPTGATYVSGSATPAADASYNSSTRTITWTIPTVPAKSGSAPGEVDLTFQVTVNGSDANGSTISNQASFSDLNTPNCTTGATTAVCLTNTVSNPVVVPPTPIVTPAPQVAPTTTTTKAPHQVLAFTGLNAETLAILAIVLVGGGTVLVLIGRRRRPNQG